MTDAATIDETKLLRWKIGDVTITRLPECSIVIPGADFLPDATPEGLARHPWLVPDFATAEGEVYLSFHALAVEAPGMKLIVDTCFGEGKAGPTMDGLKSAGDFLAGLTAIGFGRDEVDAVLCTHLHLDHVGWNTIKQDDRWVPTFPKARYLIGRKELEHWRAVPDDEQQAILGDSVQPILDAGLAELVEMDHRISPEIRLLPSPGHTPGHVCVMIESEGRRAVITGDMTHHPCQLGHPDWSPFFDSDREASARMRAGLFAQWADDDILVIGTHYAGPTAGRISREGSAFRFDG